MRWLPLALLQVSAMLLAQEPAQPSQPSSSAHPAVIPSQPPAPPILPDSPGTTFHQSATVTTPTPGLPPCPANASGSAVVTATAISIPCAPPENRSPYQRFLNSPGPFPLTPRQKGLLALHDLVDPGNIFTITANAGFTVGIDPRTAYGPGWKGFGRDVGYTFVQDATGEFVSTFVLDSLLHEDPHYHRSPQATMPRRVMHAIAHTVISQHDDGRRMVNYSTLLTYPISAEVANLYVPGVHGNAPSTVSRVLTGLASDPIDNLITEFLPDFAKRVHIRIVFVQQILNNIAADRPGL